MRQEQHSSTAELPHITAHEETLALALAEERRAVVELDSEHPGFADQDYRARRNEIAGIALRYEPGSPIPDAPYTVEEHRLWGIVLDALRPQHQDHACAEYLKCTERLALAGDRIPQLREVSEKVRALSGFSLEPVGGLVAPRVFLESLGRGVFLSTQYIRHHSTPLYTPEPDVVHELLGHAVMLASEPMAELNRLVGEAVRRTTSDEALERLARVYWFTVEFGVLREAGEIKAYGAGLVSSAGELEAMLRAELRPLDLEAASRQEFGTTEYQPVLFCADSFESMYQNLRDYLIRWR
ncbi:MAG TPA: phenylalanine 4-monooxygenase [Pyrinomonadaceae bacterium]|nr:phenylalanine 4-monooxygenase [Pyrinomonadaceae bacterium]